jgi:hypothetical protein
VASQLRYDEEAAGVAGIEVAATKPIGNDNRPGV